MKLPEGWFNEDDVKFYRDNYQQLPINGNTLEIGCFKGRSICSVADIIKDKNIKVVIIDTFQDLDVCFDGKTIIKCIDSKQAFMDNLIKFDIINNISIFHGYSEDILKNLYSNGYKFNFAFIDGDHSEEMVKKDIKLTLPMMIENSIISGHDVKDFKSVKKAVYEFFDNSLIMESNNIWFIKC